MGEKETQGLKKLDEDQLSQIIGGMNVLRFDADAKKAVQDGTQKENARREKSRTW